MTKLGDNIRFRISNEGIPVEKTATRYSSEVTATVIAILDLGNPYEFNRRFQYAVLTTGTVVMPGQLVNSAWITETMEDPSFTMSSDIQKYVGKHVRWITPKCVIDSNPRMDACQCSKCKDWVYMAQSNQEDGSFVCHPCRQDPYRFSF